MIAQATVERLPLADGSVDLIFTDPPYLSEYLHTYEWLSHEAVRVLKPGGFVLALCGGAYLDKCLMMMGDAGLDFYWLYQLELTGQGTGVVWPRGNNRVNISTRIKHYAAYSKGVSLSRTCTVGKFTDVGADKRYHHWGQAVASARYYIDCFSHPGDLVCDPFIGGGTTAVACGLLGRRCVSFDINPVALRTTRSRLENEWMPRQADLFSGMVDA